MANGMRCVIHLSLTSFCENQLTSHTYQNRRDVFFAVQYFVVAVMLMELVNVPASQNDVLLMLSAMEILL